jgi:signal transduction histidine kinase
MNLTATRILLIEDSLLDAQLLIDTLKSDTASFNLEELELEIAWVESFSAALIQLRATKFDALLLDLTLPDIDGIRAITMLQELFPTTPIVVLTGLNDRELAMLSVKNGAQDYLVKGLPSADSIRRAIKYAMERKSAELARKNLSLLEERERFIAMLAHDLRSPLSGCERLLGLLLTGTVGVIPAEQRPLLKLVADSIRSVLNIITDVLERYCLQSDMETLNLRQSDVTLIVDECLSESDYLADIKNIRLRRTGSQSIFALVDPISMRRVVLNLLNNALKFTPPGGEIETTIECNESAVIVRVRDTGPGVPAGKADRLFDRFFQCHSDNRGSGIGLGLHICQELMRAQNGTIACTSEPGSGTTFELKVPRFAIVKNKELSAA